MHFKDGSFFIHPCIFLTCNDVGDGHVSKMAAVPLSSNSQGIDCKSRIEFKSKIHATVLKLASNKISYMTSVLC
jgi:hypothetical protein